MAANLIVLYGYLMLYLRSLISISLNIIIVTDKHFAIMSLYWSLQQMFSDNLIANIVLELYLMVETIFFYTDISDNYDN